MITAVPAEIDLANCDAATLAAWSQAEGWSEKAGRGYGQRYGRGVQVRYRLKDASPASIDASAPTPAAPPARPRDLLDF